MMLANAGGGLGGHFVGRMYRNEHEYRRLYRERANVGGFFGSILNSSEFDLFLSLLCFLIVLTVLQSHLSTAPVTSIAILLMIFAHFEKDILGERNTFMTAENYNTYSFHHQHIMDGQWYRLITGPLLHKGRKLQLYLNMSALAMLCQVETRSTLPLFSYAFFFLALMATSGVTYIYCVKTYGKRGEQGLNSYRTGAGFTGVVFALKCYYNTCRTGVSGVSFPLAGDLFVYSIPIVVPSFAEHFVELFLVTVLFGNDVPFWANVGGILAGYLMLALEAIMVTLGTSDPWIEMTQTKYKYDSYDPAFPPPVETTNRAWVEYTDAFKQVLVDVVSCTKQNAAMLAFVVVVATYVYKTMRFREKELQRRLAELEHERKGPTVGKENHTDSFTLHEEIPKEVPLNGDAASATSSWSLANDHNLDVGQAENCSKVLSSRDDQDLDGSQEEDHSKESPSGDSLYDDYSASDYDLPPAFTSSLRVLTTVTEKQGKESIVETLQTLQKVITNAVTKGQEDEEQAVKYRRLRVSNPCIQKCQIDGAFALMMAVGFEVHEDFDNEQWLVYPKRKSPDWMVAAMEAIKVKLEALISAEQESGAGNSSEMAELKQRMRAAALKRQAASKGKKKKAREPQFTPGLGGGNSKAIYYRGGT